MRRIFASAAACQFLADMAARHGGPGDKCLAFAARVADVPTSTAYGMYHQFHHDNMSITAGDNAHIHYVDWNDTRFTEMLWAFEYGRREALTPDVLRAVSGRTLEFGRCVGAPLATLTLADGGSVRDACHDNESKWRVVGNELWLRNSAGSTDHRI